MNRIFFDFETTGICSYNCEVITGYFKNENGDSHYLKSKVDNWSEEAFEIHNIPYDVMLTYEDKNIAWEKLMQWMPQDFEGVFYANSNASQLYGALDNGVKHEVYFDKSVLIINIMELMDIYHYCKFPYNVKWTSVYDLAKEADKKGVFKAIAREGKRVKNFSQEMVYKAFFNDTYNAHDAKDDVNAMIRIYNELTNRMESNQGLLI